MVSCFQPTSVVSRAIGQRKCNSLKEKNIALRADRADQCTHERGHRLALEYYALDQRRRIAEDQVARRALEYYALAQQRNVAPLKTKRNLPRAQ